MTTSFIETQFPVSKLSKESYKERKAGASQTLTGLGKWWGRKPLVLVRATLLGLLLPATADPARDREVFLKLMTMDPDGLWQRFNKSFSGQELWEYAVATSQEELFNVDGPRPRWATGVTDEEKETFERELFDSLSYDERLARCARPEQVAGPRPAAWVDINAHLGTSADSLPALVQELGQRQFGHVPRVGDAFCGGGSIPFEAARLGCQAYASDLNPAAALLTWAALNIVGGGPEVQQQVRAAQEEAFTAADLQITAWGIEHNEQGWRADAYLYCVEAMSPATGYRVPLASSWVISEKYNVCAVLRPDEAHGRYHLDIVTGADAATMRAAKTGTVQSSELVCPTTGERFGIAGLRGDRRVNGETVYGLRLWENADLVPRPDDVFTERLYCVRYVETYYEYKPKGGRTTELTKAAAEARHDFAELLAKGELKEKSRRHFVAPTIADLAREQKALALLEERFADWQKKGFIPSKKIQPGYNTDQPIRERGWTHWHHLFNPRHLLTLGEYLHQLENLTITEEAAAGALLAIGAAIDNHSRLCGWNPHISKGPGTTRNVFFNLALNTQLNYAERGFDGLSEFLVRPFIPSLQKSESNTVKTVDVRQITYSNDFWITDPPYADAVNYHEVGDFFLAWYEKKIPEIFPKWYSDSRVALTVKGKGPGFNGAMVECYRNLARHMPDNGAQVVMFTHQDSAVWADLALILWASGLHVTQAWTIQTETDAVGIKTGNYVQGTVLMVLRKQQGEEVGFLSDIQPDVEYEVRQELAQMLALDDQDDPNFQDTDLQLAAYVAALRVLTSYKRIDDLDVAYELSRQRRPGDVSPVQDIIDSAVRIACDTLVPQGVDATLWRTFSGEERFYVKGLEIQRHGEYRTGVLQELARGFGLRQYTQFLKSGKANESRLMTASEYGRKQLGEEGFGQSLVRQVLMAVRETVQQGSPKAGRQWLYAELPTYWARRQQVIQVLSYIQRMGQGQEHWAEDVAAARVLEGYVRNDGV